MRHLVSMYGVLSDELASMYVWLAGWLSACFLEQHCSAAAGPSYVLVLHCVCPPTRCRLCLLPACLFVVRCNYLSTLSAL